MTGRPARRTAPGRAPRLLVEAALVQEGHLVVAGVDEVGRGCLAGPVTVGVVIVDPSGPRPPRGLRDSKLLTPQARRALVPRIHKWVVAAGVGDASSAEIDTYGIIAALRLAAHRALTSLPRMPDCVLLDGNHDYISPTDQLSFDLAGFARPVPEPVPLSHRPVVRTRVKADLTCASVAAASVLAKTTRDAFMTDLAKDHPGYGWEVNKGYATPRHRAALRRLGPSAFHRVSWRLGLDEPDALTESDEMDEEMTAELGEEMSAELGEEMSAEPGEQISGLDAQVSGRVGDSRSPEVFGSTDSGRSPSGGVVAAPGADSEPARAQRTQLTGRRTRHYGRMAPDVTAATGKVRA